jgi:hypothetical protein
MSDVAVFKNGDSASGTVVNKSFTIRTPYLGKMEIPTKKILRIHFRSSQFSQDMIRLSAIDTYQGAIQEKTVQFRVKGTGEVTSLRKENIHTILFLDNVGAFSP